MPRFEWKESEAKRGGVVAEMLQCGTDKTDYLKRKGVNPMKQTKRWLLIDEQRHRSLSCNY
jgi:hypothetical protein